MYMAFEIVSWHSFCENQFGRLEKKKTVQHRIIIAGITEKTLSLQMSGMTPDLHMEFEHWSWGDAARTGRWDQANSKVDEAEIQDGSEK